MIAGALEYCLHLDNMNLTAIRTIRVLRPLRAINRVPSMRILVMLLLDTLPMLGNVLMLCTFVFFIFGVVAVQAQDVRFLFVRTRFRKKCNFVRIRFRRIKKGKALLRNRTSDDIGLLL